jgi:aryl-alcohol dehydrogenase-like predicted oxidoreductase
MEMLPFSRLSKIGLGTYHMSSRNRVHCKALAYAIQSGCNLIDTAVNYQKGESEEMIGSYLREHPGTSCFIISKAGYAGAADLPFLGKLAPGSPDEPPPVIRYGETLHCIHPGFLRKKLRLTLSRLQRKCIDGFLLHNPEYFLMAYPDPFYKDIFYKRIEEAFSFLEECVQKGLIRYYGISSNSLALHDQPDRQPDILRLKASAMAVSSTNAFRLLQYPHNFAERMAVDRAFHGKTLPELAQTNGLRTFSNRPLNMHAKDGFVRMALYSGAWSPEEEASIRGALPAFVNMVNQRLARMKVAGSADDFEIVSYMQKHWDKIGNQAAVDLLFRDHLKPFLNVLYNDTLPRTALVGGRVMKQAEKEVVLRLYDSCRKQTIVSMSHKAAIYRQMLVERSILAKDDDRPLPVQSCDAYLRDGIDHVLAGMRSERYVDELKTLFH